MSQSSEPEIVAAIASYRHHIVEHNRQVITKLVHEAETAEAPADYDEDDAAEARRDFMLNQLCVSRPDALNADDPRRIRAPHDVLDRWDDLVAVPDLGLDGTVVEHDGAHRAVLRDQYRAGIVAGLQQQQEQGGVDVPPFPAGFFVLMGHVDRLEGPGWPLWRENGHQVRFWDGLGESEEDVAQRVWTDFDKLKVKAGDPSWEVRAAWECGAGPDATCFVVYFRDLQSGDERRRSWGWRYVVQRDTTAWVLEDIVELLGWYRTFHEPVLEDIDLVSGPVFG